MDLGKIIKECLHRPTTWEYVTSEEYDISALVFTATSGAFYLKDTSDPDEIEHELRYAGLGVGRSISLPIPLLKDLGVSISKAEYNSMGTNIYLTPWTRKTKLTKNDFAGPCLLLQGGYNMVSKDVGMSVTLALFGFATIPVIPLSLPYLAMVHAVGLFAGETAGSPGAGVTATQVAIAVDP